MRGVMYNYLSAKAIGVPTQAACNFLNSLILKYVPLVGLFSHMVLLAPQLLSHCSK